MGNKRKVLKENVSIIDITTILTGKYIGCQEAVLIIEGRLEGQINTDGDIVINPSGRVVANLKAKNISNAGIIKGNINTKEKMEIKDKGIVDGNIRYKFLSIDKGATLNGKCAYSAD